MWRAKGPEAQAQKVRSVAPITTSEPFSSLGRPYVTLRVGALPGRGFILILSDTSGREVTTPAISTETIARALEGRAVAFRYAGQSVELSPADGCLRIKAGPAGGNPLEAAFRSEDIETGMRMALER